MPKGVYTRTTKRPRHSEETKNKIRKAVTGFRHSLETKQKMSLLKKGKPSPRKGVTLSEETKLKISKNRKGYKLTKQQIENLRKINTGNKYNVGKHLPESTRRKQSEALRGENAYNWKGLTPLKLLIRGCYQNRQWIKNVFERDNYTCQACGLRGGNLEAHHINNFSDILYGSGVKTLEDALLLEEFWDIANGRTLCVNCHNKTKVARSIKRFQNAIKDTQAMGY